MNVISYTALHYGRDYLHYAIKSVIDHVDKHYILYSPIGSHGHRTDRPCPETRDELFAIAQRAAGDKLVWVDGVWPYEGAQREHIHVVAPDADVILVVDADEVWADGLVNWYKQFIYYGGKPARTVRVPIIHYWRSFNRCVLHDPAYPVRIINTTIGQGEISLPTRLKLNHFGYAQRPEIVEYKLNTHGHRNEFRRDVNWFQDVFMANRQTDCHPVGSDYWNPEIVNPLDYMPAFMAQHPYYNLEVIG